MIFDPPAPVLRPSCEVLRPSCDIVNAITIKDGKFIHQSSGTVNGKPCRVRLSRNLIMVGCNTITIEAAREIMKKHAEHFPPAEDKEVEL